jgi:hypothetical protein
MGAMAFEAESAHVGQVALAAAFSHGDDVVGIPESFPAVEIPASERASARGATQALDVVKLRGAIEPADGADAAVAFEHALAEVAGVSA